MRTLQPCPKCGSPDTLSDVAVVDRTDSGARDLSLSFPGARQVGPFRMTKMVPLIASVCANCGYSELRVKDINQLREARDRSREAASTTRWQSQTPVSETSASSRSFVLIAVSLAVLLAVGLAALVMVVMTLGPR